MDADSRLVWAAVVDGSTGKLRLALVSGCFGALLVFAVVFMYGAFDPCSVVVLLSIRNVDACPLLPARFETAFMGFACGAISHSRNY